MEQKEAIKMGGQFTGKPIILLLKRAEYKIRNIGKNSNEGPV